LERPILRKTTKTTARDWLDGAATCASAACLVHCLALPLLFAVLPALAAAIDPGEWFHAAILLLAIPTSGLALVPGWRGSGALAPLVAGMCGLVLLAAGVALSRQPVAEAVASVMGSLLLAGAHIANWRLRRAGR
jgi:hypothetical protein